MMKTFLGKKLLFITAHPDDESFTSAGTILLNNKAGGSAEVICATLGEKGMSHLPKPISPARLKTMRKKELLAAAKFLKMKVRILDFPDGGVREQQERLYKKVLPLASKINPDVIVTFGPDGMSGHHDHIAAGKVAKKIAKQLKKPVFAFTTPKSEEFNFVVKQRRAHGVYIEKIEHLAPTVSFKVDEKKKIKAIRFHKSQLTNGDHKSLPKWMIKNLMNKEYFAAWG